MRQVYDVSLTYLGRELIVGAIWGVLLVLGALTIRRIILENRTSQLFLAMIPVCLALGLAYSMDITEERVHVIKFGILGFLFARDFSNIHPTNRFLLATLAGFFVGVIDETFQWILPYRVGDVRDVVFDTGSTALGALVFLTSKKPSKLGS